MPTRRVSVRRNSQALRDQAVLEHLPLVKAIAIRVHGNLPVHLDLDDLVHAGVLGLFDAVDKYDPDKKVLFHSYAKHRIKGAILDSLRQLDWASRDLRRRQKQMDRATRELSTRLGRTPSEHEVAGEMGVDPERLNHMLMELRNAGAVSATGRGEDDRDQTQEFPGAPDFEPDHICALRQMRSELARAMLPLPARYQQVVFLYYTDDMTMKEIGEAMGVNESRVSQIHKSALQKMALALQSAGIHSCEAF